MKKQELVKSTQQSKPLSVLERITLLNILPKEGDFLTLKIIRDLRANLSFSEAEHKKACFTKTDGGMHQWVEFDTGVPIGEKATDIIVNQLNELNNAKKLHEEMISLFEKFCIK